MFKGSMVALVTPMEPSGAIDWQAFDALIERQLAADTDALVVHGTTGEAPTLTPSERSALLERAIAIAAGQVPVIAGVGTNSTQSTIEAAVVAKMAGAQATLLVCPYYNRPTQEGLYLHFKAIADAVNLPHILYNVPSRTQVDLADETVLRLSEVNNIVALKDATGDLARGRALIQSLAGKIAILSGDDATAVELMALGAVGTISVVANLIPQQIHTLCVQILAGQLESVRQLNTSLAPLYRTMAIETNPIPVKWAMARLRLVSSGIRLPLTPLSVPHQLLVEQALIEAGIL